MASYTRLSSGTWRARVRRGSIAASATFDTKREAQAWATEIEAKIDRGGIIRAIPAKTTIEELAERFKSWAESRYKDKSKNAPWRSHVRTIVRALGNHEIRALTGAQISSFRDARLAGKAPWTRPASEATARKEMLMLSRMLRYAEEELGIPLEKNPVRAVRKPSDAKARERRLAPDEWIRLRAELQRSRNPLLLPIVEFALETAMRRGEILALRWDDVLLDRQIVIARDTKNGEDRAIPLTARAEEILRNTPHRADEPRVFPLLGHSLAFVWKAAVARAGIEDLHFHDLRHEAISRLAERGDFNVLELSAISGHKTLSMLKRYTHLQAEKLAAKLRA